MKASPRSTAGAIALLLAVLAAACDDDGGSGGAPLDAEQATVSLDNNLRLSLTTSARAFLFHNDSTTLDGLGFGADVETVSCDVDPIGCEDPAPGPRWDLADEAAEIADFAAQNLFPRDFVESESGNTVTYLIPASAICDNLFGGDDVDGDPSDGEIPQEGEGPSCLDTFTQVPIRLRVTSPQEGDVFVELLVGDDRINPLDVRVYRTELGGEVDLGATRRAAEALLSAAGAEDIALPDMEGRLAAALTLLGEDHVRLTFSVPSDIRIAASGEEGNISFGLAASNPAFSLEVDGIARMLTAIVDVGALDLGFDTDFFGATACSFPDEAGCEPAPSHRIEAHLGGANASLTLTGETDSIALEGVGIGDDTTWLRLDGQDLVRVDLNATSGRRFDVTASAIDGGAEVTVTPGLALAIALSFANDVSEFFEVPAWAGGDVITLDLGGDAAPAVRFVEGAEDVIQVVRGTLTAASTYLGLDVTANAGECVWSDAADETDPFADDPHPLEGLLSGACPESSPSN